MPTAFRGRTFRGIALIDAIVAISVGAVLIASLSGVATAGAGLAAADKAASTASEILSDRLERIALLPYADVGISGGDPDGTLFSSERETVNGLSYVITISVGAVDEAANGAGADYKTVRVTVSWTGAKGPGSLSAVTYRAP
jgi:hypothetical protein